MNTRLSRLARTMTVLAALCLPAAGAHAGAFQFVSPGPVTVAAGQTFSFSLFLNADAPVTGATYFLRSDAPGSGGFRITGRTPGNSPFTDLNTANAVALDPARALLNPQNLDDLGGTLADVNAPVGPGLYRLSDFQLLALPGLAPGTYTLSTGPSSVASGADFADLPTDPGTLRVIVTGAAPVPEAGTALSLGLGLLALGGLAAARRRVRA